MTSKLDEARRAAREVLAQGRRFDDSMMNGDLIAGAVEYATSYAGDFSFALDMKAAVARKGGLSLGQARGVLNCILAEEREATKTKTHVAFDGIAALFAYASQHLQSPRIVMATDDGIVVRVALATSRSKEPGSVVVTGAWNEELADRPYFGRISKDGTFEGSPPPTVLGLLEALSIDPAGVAAAYGKLTGICCFCESGLTDPRSTDVGYGPICARKFGLPWGSKAAAA